MSSSYTSERLLRELPHPLINFIWYLWETYCNPNEQEFRVALHDSGADGQQFVINSAGTAITKNFDCCVETDIAIRKVEDRYFMEYY